MTQQELQKEIDSISRQIVEKYKPQKVILFGSAVWGNFTPDSDLDFLIIKKDTPYLGRDRMRELYRLIDKNIAADFLVYRPEEYEEGLKLGDPFLNNILRKGKVLYG
ncbi:MAG: nucleotidyltransferase domain-containing protein [Candidatus Margulisbacteria bacterium]|nr:nucleotidyltransferase domain-containing protein [Candidatus Margulisiibacteriota bacterium]MBU1617095.1 nucleotidyltransferase domain-containing protein [Candidatus Margulisiibacteriota bacterium]